MASNNVHLIKEIFDDVPPLSSKNVAIYFKDAFIVTKRTKTITFLKKIKDRLSVFVRSKNANQIFVLPYEILCEDSTKAEKSLRDALKVRGFEVVKVDELRYYR